MTSILVEGTCEYSVIPVLIRRVSNPPGRLRCVNLGGKSNIVRRIHGFEDTIRRNQRLGEHHFVVLMDADTTFAPYRTLPEEFADMPRRASLLAHELQVHIIVCWARIE